MGDTIGRALIKSGKLEGMEDPGDGSFISQLIRKQKIAAGTKKKNLGSIEGQKYQGDITRKRSSATNRARMEASVGRRQTKRGVG